MDNALNNMDDLLDDNIGKSLRQLGFTFPKTAGDFKRLEEYVKNNKNTMPARLQDSNSFLNKRAFKPSIAHGSDEEQGEYFQKLAQAARDGNEITDEIKKRMAEDKLKSGKKQKGE